MKILVTGASGFIGRHIIQTLKLFGAKIIVIGRRPLADITDVEFIECDLLAAHDMCKQIRDTRATHLLHSAWYAEHGAFWTSLENMRWVEATNRLVDAACQAGIQHITIAGTCAEYDWSYGYCNEALTPLAPATLYGGAKDATRRLTAMICRHYQVPCAWGRIFLPYGAGEDARRLVPSLMGAFLGKRDAFGVNISAYRDFLNVVDVASALVALSTHQVTGEFNISSGRPILIEQIVRSIAEFLDKDPHMILSKASERPNEPALIVGDNTKLRALGWTQSISLADGLHSLCCTR